MLKNEKIWLVGGSTGIGLELTKILLKENNQLIVSSRNASANKDLIELKFLYKENLNLLDYDVSSKSDIKEIVNQVWNYFNGLNLWFYNAGAYEVMDIDNWDYQKFEEMNNVNYLGALKLMIELLPYFREQKSGKWIWNLSLSTYFGLPKGGGYSAPKTALLNLAQSIQPELKNENISLQVINHGFVKTRLTAKNDFEMPELMSPKVAAENIFTQMEKNTTFEIRFPFKLSMFLRFLSMLPYKISLALTRKTL